MTSECPVCGLVNTSEASRCDCGYDFISHTGGRRPQRAWLTRAIVIAVGFSLGAWNLPTGLRAFFVFSARDSLSSWIAVIACYFVTIPTVFLTMARPRMAGWVFVVAGVSGSVAAAVAYADWDVMRDMVAPAGGPMVVLGAVLLWATRNWTAAPTDSESASRRTRG
jgi:hypothetical protein